MTGDTKKCPHLSGWIDDPEYTNQVNLGNLPQVFQKVECMGEECQMWWICRNPNEQMEESIVQDNTCPQEYTSTPCDSLWRIS